MRCVDVASRYLSAATGRTIRHLAGTRVEVYFFTLHTFALPSPTIQNHSNSKTTLNYSSGVLFPFNMLIKESYRDVETTANGVKGTMRIIIIEPNVSEYPDAKFPGCVVFSEVSFTVYLPRIWHYLSRLAPPSW